MARALVVWFALSLAGCSADSTPPPKAETAAPTTGGPAAAVKGRTRGPVGPPME